MHWEWRLDVIPKAGKRHDYQEELENFGWWFTNGNMDKKWMIGALLKTLELSKGRLEWTRGVLERLPEYVEEFPIEVAEVADKIVRGAKEDWEIGTWQQDLRAIFENLKSKGDKKAWAIAMATINFLGEKGYRDLGDLL